MCGRNPRGGGPRTLYSTRSRPLRKSTGFFDPAAIYSRNLVRFSFAQSFFRRGRRCAPPAAPPGANLLGATHQNFFPNALAALSCAAPLRCCSSLLPPPPPPLRRAGCRSVAFFLFRAYLCKLLRLRAALVSPFLLLSAAAAALAASVAVRCRLVRVPPLLLLLLLRRLLFLWADFGSGGPASGGSP